MPVQQDILTGGNNRVSGVISPWGNKRAAHCQALITSGPAVLNPQACLMGTWHSRLGSWMVMYSPGMWGSVSGTHTHFVVMSVKFQEEVKYIEELS